MAEHEPQERDGTGRPYKPGFAGLGQAIMNAFSNAMRSKTVTLKRDRNVYARSFRGAIHAGLSYGPSIRDTLRQIKAEAERDEGPGDPLKGVSKALRNRLQVHTRIAWVMYALLLIIGLYVLDASHGPVLIRINMSIGGAAITVAGCHLMLRAARDYWSITMSRRMTIREQMQNPDDYWLPWPRHSIGKYIAATLLVAVVGVELFFLAGAP